MTTAHRPTWHPARGGNDQGGNRALVPTRQFSSKDAPAHTKLKFRQTGQGSKGELYSIDFRRKLLEAEINSLVQKDSESEEEHLSDSHSEQDSEEELHREFLKVKAERVAAEQELKEQERLETLKLRQIGLLEGNLLETAPGFSLKRKWYEETVFKSQSRTQPMAKRPFTNDTVRNPKHKAFLSKFIH